MFTQPRRLTTVMNPYPIQEGHPIRDRQLELSDSSCGPYDKRRLDANTLTNEAKDRSVSHANFIGAHYNQLFSCGPP